MCFRRVEHITVVQLFSCIILIFRSATETKIASHQSPVTIRQQTKQLIIKIIKLILFVDLISVRTPNSFCHLEMKMVLWVRTIRFRRCDAIVRKCFHTPLQPVCFEYYYYYYYWRWSGNEVWCWWLKKEKEINAEHELWHYSIFMQFNRFFFWLLCSSQWRLSIYIYIYITAIYHLSSIVCVVNL